MNPLRLHYGTRAVDHPREVYVLIRATSDHQLASTINLFALDVFGDAKAPLNGMQLSNPQMASGDRVRYAVDLTATSKLRLIGPA